MPAVQVPHPAEAERDERADGGQGTDERVRALTRRRPGRGAGGGGGWYPPGWWGRAESGILLVLDGVFGCLPAGRAVLAAGQGGVLDDLAVLGRALEGGGDGVEAVLAAGECVELVGDLRGGLDLAEARRICTATWRGLICWFWRIGTTFAPPLPCAAPWAGIWASAGRGLVFGLSSASSRSAGSFFVVDHEGAAVAPGLVVLPAAWTPRLRTRSRGPFGPSGSVAGRSSASPRPFLPGRGSSPCPGCRCRRGRRRGSRCGSTPSTPIPPMCWLARRLGRCGTSRCWSCLPGSG